MRTALRDNSLPTIVTAEVRDESKLYPDENFYHIGQLVNTTTMYESQQTMLKRQQDWKRCLDTIGLAANKGPIPPEQVICLETMVLEDNLYYPFIKNSDKTFEAFDLAFQGFMKFMQAHPSAKRGIFDRLQLFEVEVDLNTRRVVIDDPVLWLKHDVTFDEKCSG
jgi:hypothetical protein